MIIAQMTTYIGRIRQEKNPLLTIRRFMLEREYRGPLIQQLPAKGATFVIKNNVKRFVTF